MSLEVEIMRALALEDSEEVRSLTITWTSPNPPVVDAEIVFRRSSGELDESRTRTRQSTLFVRDQTNEPR